MQGQQSGKNSMNNIESRKSQNLKPFATQDQAAEPKHTAGGSILELKIIEGKINKAKHDVESDET